MTRADRAMRHLSLRLQYKAQRERLARLNAEFPGAARRAYLVVADAPNVPARVSVIGHSISHAMPEIWRRTGRVHRIGKATT